MVYRKKNSVIMEIKENLVKNFLFIQGLFRFFGFYVLCNCKKSTKLSMF
ncbi:hypothetical protein CLV48_10217 [Cecembia rubra]|uniref:Uncharacterized protein n=1 Tax=Cecembia rubra TaxID=1485585 RepID=A0A2P8E9S6_9BACT|nr:hypothetical protein CLV48_10217 [Cecembia rubra]